MMRTNPNGLEKAFLLLPCAGKQLAIAPIARNASKQFQKETHLLQVEAQESMQMCWSQRLNSPEMCF